MRIVMAWMIAAAAAGCMELDEPEAREVSLAELPLSRLVYGADSRSVWVALEYSVNALGTCAILAPDFGGSVNGTRMQIQRGGAGNTGSCRTPRLDLMAPPSASTAAITLGDHSRTLTINLGDLLAPRKLELVPAGPWQFSPGQQVTVRWSPSADLSRSPRVGITGGANLPLAIQGDSVTFTMPELPFVQSGELQFGWSPGTDLGCTICLRMGAPLVVQSFSYL